LVGGTAAAGRRRSTTNPANLRFQTQDEAQLMARPTFNGKDADADLVVVGSGVVGALIAEQIARTGRSVLVLEAGPRLDRGEVVENWRNIGFTRRVSNDFDGPFPQSPYAPAPLYFPPNDYVGLSGRDGKSYVQGYIRAVGGTTWHWAASCWRHLPVDLT